MEELIENAQYRVDLGASTWLMHDHRWALYSWEADAENRPCALIHVDHHWDAINDFKDSHQVEELRRASLADIESWTEDWSGRIGYANFIAPAIIRGLVNEVHFLCEQSYGSDGFMLPFLAENEATQTFHDSLDALLAAASTTKQPTIFDLDLDLFHKGSNYFGKEIEVITDLSGVIRSADVVTVATSRMNQWRNGDERIDDWEWDTSLAERVANNVLPLIKRIRGI